MKKFNTIRAALVTLLMLTGIAVALGGTKTTKTDKTTTRVVELELTFANGDVARVRQFDSAPFTIDDHGKVLTIVPVSRDVKSGTVQLEISRANSNELKPIGTFAIGGEPAAIKGADGLASVKLNGFEQVAASSVSVGPKGCCARDCSGRLICDALCVCTRCGVCGPCFCVPFPLP